jgi:hypothetical protein
MVRRGTFVEADMAGRLDNVGDCHMTPTGAPRYLHYCGCQPWRTLALTLPTPCSILICTWMMSTRDE